MRRRRLQGPLDSSSAYLIDRATSSRVVRVEDRKPWRGEPLVSLILGAPALCIVLIAIMSHEGWMPVMNTTLWRTMVSTDVTLGTATTRLDPSGILIPTQDFWHYMLVALVLSACGTWFSRKRGRPLISISALAITGVLMTIGYLLVFYEAS